MPNLGFSELIIVLLIIVVVFGSTKLPQLGDGLGRAIKNFKRAVTNQNEIEVSPKKESLRERDACRCHTDRREEQQDDRLSRTECAQPTSSARQRARALHNWTPVKVGAVTGDFSRRTVCVKLHLDASGKMVND